MFIGDSSSSDFNTQMGAADPGPAARTGEQRAHAKATITVKREFMLDLNRSHLLLGRDVCTRMHASGGLAVVLHIVAVTASSGMANEHVVHAATLFHPDRRTVLIVGIVGIRD